MNSIYVLCEAYGVTAMKLRAGGGNGLYSETDATKIFTMNTIEITAPPVCDSSTVLTSYPTFNNNIVITVSTNLPSSTQRNPPEDTGHCNNYNYVISN